MVPIVHARSEHRELAAPVHPRPGTTVRAHPSVQLAVTDDLGAVESEWRRFERYADCTAFQAFDWLSAWQTCIGSRRGVRPAIVTGRGPSGTLLFLLPLATQPIRFGRQLMFLGAELADYNAPLLAPDLPQAFAPSFAALWREIDVLLRRHGYRYDVVVLDKMPDRVGAQPNPMLALPTAPNPSGAYRTRLAGDWESFYAAKRSSATRRRDRTKRKRLGEIGAVRMVTPDDPADVLRNLDMLMAQKSRALARMGVADIFASPDHRAFYSHVAVRAPDLVHVSRLEVGTTAAATNLGLLFRDCYYHVLASYDDGPAARFGPGAAHLHELMRHAIARGCDHFDFTIGDEPYKREWCDIEFGLFDHVAATSLRGYLSAVPLAAWRRLKRYLKHSRVLWPLVARLRAGFSPAKAVSPSTHDGDPATDRDPR